MRLVVGPAPRHYTGPPGGSAAGAHGFLVFWQLFGSGGSFRHRGPSIANTQRVGSDVATQIVDLEARSADGEELGCEPSRADSDATQIIDLEVRSVDGEELVGCEPPRADSDNRHTAADGAP